MVAGRARVVSTAALSEPERPDMKTEIPGPKSKQLLQELSAIVVSTDGDCYEEQLNFPVFFLPAH